MTTIYGIKNCDTMKKAFRWLDDNKVVYEFHDYKKSGIDDGALKSAIKTHGWQNVINRRGTTWRKLDKSIQETMNDSHARTLAHENPSIVKRPLLMHKNNTHLGFSAGAYQDIFTATLQN